MRISLDLKNKASAAFRDNSLLSELSAEEREEAAQEYERIAAITRGDYASLARRYNLERAKFLRGQVGRIAHPAHEFFKEINYGEEGGTNDV